MDRKVCSTTTTTTTTTTTSYTKRNITIIISQGENDLHPIRAKTLAPQYEPIERKKRNEKQ